MLKLKLNQKKEKKNKKETKIIKKKNYASPSLWKFKA